MYTKLQKMFASNKPRLIYPCLAGGVVILTLLLLLSGPRIRRVTYDSAMLPRESNQTIVFHSNQPLVKLDKSQVSIVPAVEFNLTTNGEAVIIQLKQRLNYDSQYNVTIKDIKAKSARKSSFRTIVKTDVARYYYLKRDQNISLNSMFGEKSPDTIYCGGVTDEDEAVYQAHKILAYAMLDSRLVILHQDEDAQQHLTVYDPKNKTEDKIVLPEPDGSVDQLAVSSTDKLVGFLFSSKYDPQGDDNKENRYNSTLFTYDTDLDFVSPLYGIESGKTISASNWRFHPDGTTVIVQTFDNSVLLVDYYAKQKAIPLGSYFSIGNFSRNGKRVVLGDNDIGIAILDLQSQHKETPDGGLLNGAEAGVSGIRLLQNDEGFIQTKEAYSLNDSAYSWIIESVKGVDRQELYRSSNQIEQLFDFSSSKNDQYLTLEVSEATDSRQFDGYSTYSRPSNIRTIIVGLEEGKRIKEVDGFQLQWY